MNIKKSLFLLALTVNWLNANNLDIHKDQNSIQFEVIGNQKQDKASIILKTGLYDINSPNDINLTLILNKLWDTNLFDDIKLDLIKQDAFIKLMINVKERPIIKDIEYHDSKKVINTAYIEKQLQERKIVINKNTIYDAELTRKIKSLLIDIAQEKGYIYPIVDVRIESMGPAVSKLVFDINVGSKIVIQDIQFKGNINIKSNKLISILQTKQADFITNTFKANKTTLTQKNISQFIAKIKQEYWRNGYKDIFIEEPKIEYVDKISNKKHIEKDNKTNQFSKKANLVFLISEGDFFAKGLTKIICDNEIDGHHELQVEKLYKKIHKNNKSANLYPYDLNIIQQCIEEIFDNYRNKGYAQCDIQQKIEIVNNTNINHKTINTLINIKKGSLVTVNRIDFEGNSITKDKVLRRNLILNEGDVFKPSYLRDSLLQLSQLGFFKIKTNPDIIFSKEDSAVDITISGEETNLNTLLVQGGYGTRTGFVIGSSILTKNLFGSGQALSFNLSTSKDDKSFSIQYEEPSILDTPYSAFIGLSNRSTSYVSTKETIPIYSKRLNRSISLNGQTKLSTFISNINWTNFTTLDIGYKFYTTRAQSNLTNYNDKNRITSSICQGIHFNTTNHPYRATYGQYLNLDFEYGGWQFGTDYPFFKTAVKYKKFISITKKNILSLSTSFDQINFKRFSDTNYDIIDMLKTGGEDSVRGYDFESIGPTILNRNNQQVFIGGNKQLICNLEYLYNLTNMTQLVLFFDAGQSYDNVFKNQKMRSSIGAELRLFLPIAQIPLRFIWAHKLNPYGFDTKKATNFQFCIGIMNF